MDIVSNALASPVVPPIDSGRLVDSVSRSADGGGDLKRVASEFEGLFVSMLLKNMRSSIGGDGLFAGDRSDTMGGMFDMFMSDHLADSDAFGIRAMIQSYIDNANPSATRESS